jgi:hypothetical protein
MITFFLKVISLLIKTIFVACWKSARIACHLVRLLSPHYRRSYHHRKFEKAKTRLLESQIKKRNRLAGACRRKNASQLGGIVLQKLRSRKRDVTPNVLYATDRTIRKSVTEIDVERLAMFFGIIVKSDPSELNGNLMTVCKYEVHRAVTGPGDRATCNVTAA